MSWYLRMSAKARQTYPISARLEQYLYTGASAPVTRLQKLIYCYFHVSLELGCGARSFSPHHELSGVLGLERIRQHSSRNGEPFYHLPSLRIASPGPPLPLAARQS